MEYISIPREKIQALSGFEPLPVEVKISKVHAIPSELAGPGMVSFYLQLKILLCHCQKKNIFPKQMTVRVTRRSFECRTLT